GAGVPSPRTTGRSARPPTTEASGGTPGSATRESPHPRVAELRAVRSLVRSAEEDVGLRVDAGHERAGRRSPAPPVVSPGSAGARVGVPEAGGVHRHVLADVVALHDRTVPVD